jgi:hypothetical protein
MPDLLIGAYIWGLLDGYLHNSNAAAEAAGDNSAEAAIQAAADQMFRRLFGDERAGWVRNDPRSGKGRRRSTRPSNRRWMRCAAAGPRIATISLRAIRCCSPVPAACWHS